MWFFNDYDQFFSLFFFFFVEKFDHFATKTRGPCEGAKGFFWEKKKDQSRHVSG
jgi:hypothetical protein